MTHTHTGPSTATPLAGDSVSALLSHAARAAALARLREPFVHAIDVAGHHGLRRRRPAAAGWMCADRAARADVAVRPYRAGTHTSSTKLDRSSPPFRYCHGCTLVPGIAITRTVIYKIVAWSRPRRVRDPSVSASHVVKMEPALRPPSHHRCRDCRDLVVGI